MRSSSGCSSLTVIELPPSVQSIGDEAFQGCTALASLDLGELNSMGERAFAECDSLTVIDFPDSLLGVGVRAFQNCTGLECVGLPASITYIGAGAFEGCTSLTQGVFFGDAPTLGAADVFANTAQDLALNYFEGEGGFSGSLWASLPITLRSNELEQIASITRTAEGLELLLARGAGAPSACAIQPIYRTAPGSTSATLPPPTRRRRGSSTPNRLAWPKQASIRLCSPASAIAYQLASAGCCPLRHPYAIRRPPYPLPPQSVW